MKWKANWYASKTIREKDTVFWIEAEGIARKLQLGIRSNKHIDDLFHADAGVPSAFKTSSKTQLHCN
jgi:hypothetical protein